MYEKLKAIGFGGKTLSIIKSLYHNDNITFLLNGQFTDPLWLTQGVKQGLHKIPFNTLPILTILLIGCNLSPLLFSIFINALGPELNQTNLGIPLNNINIATLFFADDIVLIGKTRAAMNKLMSITRDFFSKHHLELSTLKSKIMSHDSVTGKTSFTGNQDLPTITLDQVAAFKYLGVTISSSPYAFFRAHNENAKAKARQYLQSVMSLVKSGPDRTDLAFALWSNCALPAILYGCEVVPLNQGTILEIERCQCRVGKFIMQIPTSSSNVSTNIDCGFKPVWAVVAERVLLYARNLISKPVSYWPKLAYQEQLDQGGSSSYMKYLNKWKDATNSYGINPTQIRKNINHYAIKSIHNMQHATSTTSFALNCPGTISTNRWFTPKPWINDSGFTKMFAEFRNCNTRLGNRGPTKDGRFFKLCPLCSTTSSPQLNNEVPIKKKKKKKF